MGSKSEVVFPLVVSLILCLPNVAYSQTIMTANFVMTVQGKGQCPDPSYAESSVIVPARSQLDCARRCNIRDDCIYHDYRKNDKICHLYTSTPDKLLPTPDCKFMANIEAFEGALPRATVRIDPTGCSLPFQYKYQEYNECINVVGFDTPQCVTPNGYLTSCIVPPGYIAKQDVVDVTMGTSRVPLPYINNWIIMMNRVDGSVAFDRSWADYKVGFGDIRTSEFWIGNENIHLYTNQPGASYRLRIEFQGLTTGQWFYAEYTTFSVDSEANAYTIHLAGFVGNSDDSVTNTSKAFKYYLSGMKFSTYDVDNDLKSNGSCASKYPAGWWFNHCMSACLTCVHGTYDFHWSTLKKYTYEIDGLLRAVRLMIRRNYP